MKQKRDVYAIHTNGNDEVWIGNTVAALSCGGGKPGQGYQAIVYGIDCKGKTGTGCYTEDVMPTLIADSEGKAHAVCYRLCSTGSNSWKSDNPDTGCYETDVAPTLDTKADPTCNQGGGYSS